MTKIGERARTRTWDPLIKSQLLYHLSYAPHRYRRRGAGTGRTVGTPPQPVNGFSPSFAD